MTESTADDDLKVEIVRKYVDDGLSVRLTAEAVGKSFGFVHRILKDAGVTIRSRGGARKKPATEAGN